MVEELALPRTALQHHGRVTNLGPSPQREQTAIIAVAFGR